MACGEVLSNDAVGRMLRRLLLIDGAIELDATRLLTFKELRKIGRLAPPNDEVG